MEAGNRLARVLVCLSFVMLLAVLGLAQPTEVWVSVSGDDNNPGTQTQPFKTIQKGINTVAPGGKVNVEAGTYTESIVIQKPVQVIGEGASSTFIDLSSDPNAGTVVTIQNLNGDVTLSGFTIKTGPASQVASNGIYVGGGGLTGGTITISDCVIRCHQVPEGTVEDNFGLIAGYLSSAAPKLIFTRNKVYGGGSNPVLIERWLGPTEITYNEFDNGVKDDEASDVIFMMNYGGTTITAKQLIAYNTFDMGWGATYDYAHRGAGVGLAGSYYGGTSPGGFTNVEISYNVFKNLKPYRRGIVLWNNSSNGDGGNLANVVIKGNRIYNASGYTGQFGIRILGKATNVRIEENEIYGVASAGVEYAVSVEPWNGHGASGVVINSNTLRGTQYGVHNAVSEVVDARYNWWGDVTGPSGGVSDPVTGRVANGTGDRVSANVRFDPWLNAPYPGGVPVGSGDVNGDGEADAQDIVFMAQFIAGLINLDPAQQAAADINQDGVVNIEDLRLSAQQLIGME